MLRGRPPKIQNATPAILEWFTTALERVYTTQRLAEILAANRQEWQLATTTKLDGFINGEIAEYQIVLNPQNKGDDEYGQKIFSEKDQHSGRRGFKNMKLYFHTMLKLVNGEFNPWY